MKRKWACASLCMFFPLTVMAALTTVTPKALTGPLTSPGIGVASFHQGYGETLGPAGYPNTRFEYERLCWRGLEPVEGRYNSALVGDAFRYAAAHRPTMNVGLRFMALTEPRSGSQIPGWLIKKGVKGTWTPNKETFAPDLGDPLFTQYSQRLLNVFGKRYDGNENLAFVDISMVGSWGEWHNGNSPNLKPLLERYATAQLDRYVAMHSFAFPVTSRTMLISGGQSLTNAVARGAGWRAGCWGDLRIFSDAWNHMADDYPQRLLIAQQNYSGFNDAWKRAPMSLEICLYMQGWKNTFHYTCAEVQGISDWVVKQHVSTINLKSRTIPSDYRPMVDDTLTKLGYRFRPASLSHESMWDSGQTPTSNSTWYDEGTAPIYLPYMLAFRVVDSANKAVAQENSAEDIHRWLPGKYQASYALSMPGWLAKGQYAIEVTILDKSGAARINFANEGKQSSG